MTEPTIWPARRVGGERDERGGLVGARVVCGRKAIGMGYVCLGEIAKIPYGGSVVVQPPGLKRSDPVVEDVPHWEWTERAQRKLRQGSRPDAGLSKMTFSAQRRGGAHQTPPSLPFTRKCPHCGCIALVSSDVLEF